MGGNATGGGHGLVPVRSAASLQPELMQAARQARRGARGLVWNKPTVDIERLAGNVSCPWRCQKHRQGGNTSGSLARPIRMTWVQRRSISSIVRSSGYAICSSRLLCDVFEQQGTKASLSKVSIRC